MRHMADYDMLSGLNDGWRLSSAYHADAEKSDIFLQHAPVIRRNIAPSHVDGSRKISDLPDADA